MLLILDNFDSFTYNLVHAFQMLGEEVRVIESDASIGACLELQPDLIVISPGPGNPNDAGLSVDLIKACAGNIPILGVCLGHQAIAYAFGGQIKKAPRVMHGFLSEIYHQEAGIFCGLPSPFLATRYHSLVVDAESLPECIEITAKSADGEIMGIRHRNLEIEGIQFHPEALLTEWGLKLLSNCLKRKEHYVKATHFFVNRGSLPSCLIR